MKMPPVGNFPPPLSVSKESKKRRGGAGSQITVGTTAVDSASVTVSQNNKNGILRGNVNKVSVEISLLLALITTQHSLLAQPAS